MSQAIPVSERDAPGASAERLAFCYRMMVRIRAFEVAAEESAAAGWIRGMIHSAVGQEAVAAGVCQNLRRDDRLTSTHRNHHHALAKGVDPAAAMAELFGRATGVCGGKGGSMHIADLGVGLLGANGVVGASVVLAAGAAQGLHRQGASAIAVALFGDGGLNRGQCLEAMNYAAVYRLPLLLVCEDNDWAATTAAAEVSAGHGALARAAALGVPGLGVDGNDVEAVDRAAATLIGEVRAGGGPRLLHCRTYRWRGHTAVDPARYRDPDEHAARVREDPIARCAARLRELGLAAEVLEALRAAEEQRIREAVEAAERAPLPPPQAAFRDVQDADLGIAP